MSQDNNDYDWQGYGSNKYAKSGYGGMQDDDKQDQDNEFKDIRISMGEKKFGADDAKNDQELGLEDIKLGNQRKSEVSTGDDSMEGKPKERLNKEDLEQKANRCCNCLHIDYYQQYFDVTSQDVLQRLLFSLVPFTSKLEGAIGDNPDMYGPFWIFTVLIFFLTFSENMHSYLLKGADDFEYNFRNFPPSIVTVYVLGFGAPVALSCLMKYLNGTELRFKEVTCIYGYSFSSI
jgi:hypothetical protein